MLKIDRKYGPLEAWAGFLFNVDASQIFCLGGGAAGNWAHYEHPKLGRIVVHEHDVYAGKRIFFNRGIETEECQAFVSGFLGRRPFPTDRKGKEIYYAGIVSESESRQKESQLVA